MQRQQAGDGLRGAGRGPGIVFIVGQRHFHRLVVHHHHGGAGLGGCLGGLVAAGVDGGHGIGDVDAHARLEGARVEVLAQRGDGGGGILGRNAAVLQCARQRVARIQRDGARLHTGIAVGVIGFGRRRQLRHVAADLQQPQEQFVGEGDVGGGNRGARHRQGAHRHPGDDARHGRGHAGGNRRPAAIGGGQRRPRPAHPALPAGKGKLAPVAHVGGSVVVGSNGFCPPSSSPNNGRGAPRRSDRIH